MKLEVNFEGLMDSQVFKINVKIEKNDHLIHPSSTCTRVSGLLPADNICHILPQGVKN